MGEQLMPWKARCELSRATIARVDAANQSVKPYCATGSAADPAEGVAVVERAVDLLRIIKRANRE